MRSEEKSKEACQGELFGSSLMSNPLAAWEWSSEIFGQKIQKSSGWESFAAIYCISQFDSEWSKRHWDRLLAVRIKCLASSVEPDFKTILVERWEAEHKELGHVSLKTGMAAWIEAMNMCSVYGVKPETAKELAQEASDSPAMKVHLDEIDALQIDGLIHDACRLQARAPDDWQNEQAKRMSPDLAFERLYATFWPNPSGGFGMPKKSEGMSSSCAKILAERVFESKELSAKLVGCLLSEKLDKEPCSRFDALEGVFAALLSNPAPWKGVENTRKHLIGSKSHLSLAMELLCSERKESAMAAFEWAAILGAGGRIPEAERTNGEKRLKFSKSVRVCGEEGAWGRGKVSVQSPQDVAMLWRDKGMSKKLSELGWGVPNKYRAGDLAKKLLASLSELSSEKSPPHPLWDGGGSIEQAAEGLLAFWESMHLERALRKQNNLADGKPKSRL